MSCLQFLIESKIVCEMFVDVVFVDMGKEKNGTLSALKLSVLNFWT